MLIRAQRFFKQKLILILIFAGVILAGIAVAWLLNNQGGAEFKRSGVVANGDPINESNFALESFSCIPEPALTNSMVDCVGAIDENLTEPQTTMLIGLVSGSLEECSFTGQNFECLDISTPLLAVTDAPILGQFDGGGEFDTSLAAEVVDPFTYNTSLSVAEGGNFYDLSIAMNSSPGTEGVSVTLDGGTQSSIYGESTYSIDFNSDTWEEPQTVSLQAVDDVIAEGEHNAPLSLSVSSSNAIFNTLTLPDVTINIEDNDLPGIIVSENSISMFEGGSVKSVGVRLDSQPEPGTVVRVLRNFDSNEVISSTSSSELIFNETNWNKEVFFDITAVDDNIDFDQSTVITFSVDIGNTTDTQYSASTVSDEAVNITLIDNDEAGIEVSRGQLSTVEGGSVDFVEVWLASEPKLGNIVTVTGNVAGTEVELSTDGVEFSASEAIVFDNNAWGRDNAQQVFVRAVDDTNTDGLLADTVLFTNTQSADSTSPYNPSNNNLIRAIQVDAIDEDTTGVILNAIDGLVVDEAGVISKPLTVGITTIPNPGDQVQIDLVYDGSQISVNGSVTGNTSVMLDNSSQFVDLDIVAVNDGIVESDLLGGVHTSLISTSLGAATNDSGYIGLTNFPRVEASIIDDDEPGITISNFVDSLGGALTLPYEVSEDSGEISYDVVLDSEPQGAVYVQSVHGDNFIDAPDTAQNPLVFDSSNWDEPQTISLTSVNNDTIDDSLVNLFVTSIDSLTQPEYEINSSGFEIKILDDDVPGVTVRPLDSSGVLDNTNLLDEDLPNIGDKLGYVLDAQPSDNVTIFLQSIDNNIIFDTNNSNLISLSFTPSNWNVEQIVDVFAVIDDVDRGSTYNSEIYVSSFSSDREYGLINVPNQVYQITDNDQVGVNVVRYDSENNSQDAVNQLDESHPSKGDYLRISLTSRPLGGVNVDFSTDSNQMLLGGSLESTSSLQFRQDDWNVEQFIQVFPIDDQITELNPHSSDVSFVVTSTDSLYDNFSLSTQSFDIQDNDEVGLNADKISVTIQEAGGGTDSVVLSVDSQPATGENVIAQIALDNSEVRLSTDGVSYNNPSESLNIVFNENNWNGVTVFVQAEDDTDNEGLHMSTLTPSIISTDATVSNFINLPIEGEAIVVTIIDDESASFVASDYSIELQENGASENIEISLTQAPLNEVTIDLTITDTSEVGLSNSSLVFTSSNWNIPQIVIITSVDDEVVRDDSTEIILSVDPLSDVTYSVMPDQTIVVDLLDNDQGGIVVNSFIPVNGQISEFAGAFVMDVVLLSEPESSVYIWAGEEVGERFVITPEEASQSIGDCDPSGLNCRYHLEFNPNNWDQPQTITFEAQDDNVDAPNFIHNFVLTSNMPLSPENYRLNSSSYGLTIIDNDGAGITVASTDGDTTVIEDGTGDFVNIALDTMPQQNVTLKLNAGAEIVVEGGSSTSIVFTPANWNQAQPVFIEAVDDSIIEGRHSEIIDFDIITSDPAYTLLNPNDFLVDIVDNENAGFVLDTFSVTVDENGGTASVSVELTAIPQTDVILTINSNDEGIVEVTPASLTITPTNWNNASSNQFTITGVNDNQIGDRQVQIDVAVDNASDSAFTGLSSQAVVATVIDNDSVGVLVTETGDSTIGVEGSNSLDIYRLVLSVQPTHDVNIVVDPEEQIQLNGSGYGQPIQVIFTPGNWNQAQVVEVETIDDSIQEGNHTATISHLVSSTDTTFNALVMADIVVDITDNEVAGVVVTSNDNVTQENGNIANVFFTLSSEPTTEVTIPVILDDVSEGSLGGVSQITITPENWNNPTSNFVVISGVDDELDDGDVSYNLLTEAPTTSDPGYAALTDTDILDFGLVNEDDDVAGVEVTLLDSITSESGDAGEFTVQLTSKPIAPVQIEFTSSDVEEGTVQGAIQIEIEEWDVPQSIVVNGVDDADNDDNQDYSILTNNVVSNDTRYDALSATDVLDVELVNEDNESVQVIVTSTAQQTSEAGQTATVSFELSKQPINNADVIIPLSIDNPDEGDIQPVAVSNSFLAGVTAHAVGNYDLVIKNSNWNNPSANTVTIKGNNDPQIDGDQNFRLITGNPISDDTTFDVIAGGDIADLVFTNQDNDVDTDGDGNSDEQEILDGTDPSNVQSFLDSDGDEVPDALESEQGTDPANASSFLDSDGDGIPNIVEIRDGTDPNDPSSFLDSDGDGLSSFQERQQGSESPFVNEDGNGSTVTPRTGGLLFIPLGILAGAVVFVTWKTIKRRVR